MVADTLNYLMVHPGKHNNLEERLDGAQKLIRVWAYLVHKSIAKAVSCINLLTAGLIPFFLLLDDDVVLFEIIHQLKIVKFLATLNF